MVDAWLHSDSHGACLLSLRISGATWIWRQGSQAIQQLTQMMIQTSKWALVLFPCMHKCWLCKVKFVCQNLPWYWLLAGSRILTIYTSWCQLHVQSVMFYVTMTCMSPCTLQQIAAEACHMQRRVSEVDVFLFTVWVPLKVVCAPSLVPQHAALLCLHCFLCRKKPASTRGTGEEAAKGHRPAGMTAVRCKTACQESAFCNQTWQLFHVLLPQQICVVQNHWQKHSFLGSRHQSSKDAKHQSQTRRI